MCEMYTINETTKLYWAKCSNLVCRHLVVPLNAVYLFWLRFTVSHDCPKWRLIRSQSKSILIPIVMTMGNHGNFVCACVRACVGLCKCAHVA